MFEDIRGYDPAAYHAEYLRRRKGPPRPASRERLRAMAVRLAAPTDDDEAACDELFDMALATEKLTDADQAVLDRLLCREMSREPAGT
jgi:hypothetical protein